LASSTIFFRYPAEFLGGFSTIFFLQGRVIPTPKPHPG